MGFVYRDLDDIALEAYVYLYPLVMMEATKQQLRAARPSHLDPTQDLFVHQMNTATDKWRSVARPNIDTLFSSAWADLSAGPALLTIPPAEDRYHMFQLLDFWTDVFAVPGSRSNGQNGVVVKVVGPEWADTAVGDDGEDFVLRSPTPTIWALGRTAADSGEDLENARAFVRRCTLVPLTSPGFSSEPDEIDPDLKGTPPVTFVDGMSPAKYFESADIVLRREGAHATDGSVRMRLTSLGLGTRTPFVFDDQPAEVRDALTRAVPVGTATIRRAPNTAARLVNGWTYSTGDIGTWGNNYLRRAFVARIGIAANPAEDAVYVQSIHDHRGDKLDGGRAYVLRFDTPPPAHAFWSVTAYDREGFLISNELDRFGIRSRDDFAVNGDGSFDIRLDPMRPSPDATDNWIPTKPGPLALSMRLYMPRAEFIAGTWSPPSIVAV